MNRQPSLFDNLDETNNKENIPIIDGTLIYFPHFLQAEAASALQQALRQKVDWEQSTIRLYGKPRLIPRLNAWYGDASSPYHYSGHHFIPKPWLAELYELKQEIETASGFAYNSVLANCYRDGSDSVAWHSDDEPELGQNPVVASLSLGVERVFLLKHRFDSSQETKKLLLGHGSLLVMSGPLQHFWRHQLPKTTKKIGERINLTYRYVNSV